jgi:hypothetical protein
VRVSLVLLALIPFILMGQTPLEFGIVRDLVGGTPRISVYSIKTVTEDGVRTLQVAARAGIEFDCTRHSMLTGAETVDRVLLEGQISYTASVITPVVERFFSVVRQNMNTHGAGGIAMIRVDLITLDEMGWLSAEVPVGRVDSLIRGDISHSDFWAVTPVREIEVGTNSFPVLNASPLPELHGAPVVPQVVQQAASAGGCAWKSLLLPGWGQMCSDSGLPIVNFLVEAGGIALLFTEDYREAGIGVLVVNHLVSFADLL